MKVIGSTVGMGLPKPDLTQSDPKRGDYVFGKDEFLNQHLNRQVTDVSMVKLETVVTVTTTWLDGQTVVSEIHLDPDGYPMFINTDDVMCSVSWEGFDE